MLIATELQRESESAAVSLSFVTAVEIRTNLYLIASIGMRDFVEDAAFLPLIYK